MNKELLTLVLLSLGSAANAHTGADAGAHHGLFAGFAHPFTGLDHLAAMLAVGLWSAGTAQRRWLAPLGFVTLLVLGATLGLALPAVETMIAVSLLACGLLLMSPWRAPAGAALLAGFALFHGAAHGQELGGSWALAGMAAGTAALHGLGIALGIQMHQRSIWLPRATGLIVAALGVGLLA